MPEYFVWHEPSHVSKIEAANGIRAAEVFLGFRVTMTSELEALPACYVQASNGHQAPRFDLPAAQFWAVTGRDK